MAELEMLNAADHRALQAGRRDHVAARVVRIATGGFAAAPALFRSGNRQLAYCMAGLPQHIPVRAEKRNARLANGF